MVNRIKKSESIEARIKRLENIEVIKRLKARYCYTFDEGRMDELMDCFARECSADFGPRGGRYSNRKDVEKRLIEAHESMSFSNHMIHNPIIEVEADTASGMVL